MTPGAARTLAPILRAPGMWAAAVASFARSASGRKIGPLGPLTSGHSGAILKGSKSGIVNRRQHSEP